jgi:RNA polymerase sigma factor (sigma-70 family)
MSTDPVAGLVGRAAEGDEDAWNGLVERFSGLVWAIARGYRLDTADAADVSQTVWLRLVEHLGRLRDPSRVGAWIATATRRECLRVARVAGRYVLTDSEDDLEAEPDDDAAGRRLLRQERDTVLWREFEHLSARCRALLRVLVADPTPSYEEVAAALDMPIGSIGPTRARCLEQLRGRIAVEGITGVG